MQVEDRQMAERCLRHMLIGSQFDGIKFGQSSATTLIHFMHYTTHSPDQIWIHMESKWGIYPENTPAYPNSEEEMDDLTEEEEYRLLFELRWEKVIDIRLGDYSPHLYITFESGKVLFIYGYHPKYECWQAGDGSGYTSDEWLVVAMPQNGISTWSPLR